METRKLSPIKRAALKILDNLKEQIITDCDDGEIVEALERFNPENNGYVREDQYMNYDQAMKVVGIGNRTTFNEICKRNNVVNYTFKNAHIGFRKKDIEKLAIKLKEERE